jgi:hypothetical protein
LASFDRIIHVLHVIYTSLPFTLVFPLAMLGVVYVNDFVGHLLALVGLTILLIIEAPPVLRRLLLITLPLVTVAYLFGRAGSMVMLGWLVAWGIRIAAR